MRSLTRVREAERREAHEAQRLREDASSATRAIVHAHDETSNVRQPAGARFRGASSTNEADVVDASNRILAEAEATIRERMYACFPTDVARPRRANTGPTVEGVLRESVLTNSSRTRTEPRGKSSS